MTSFSELHKLKREVVFTPQRVEANLPLPTNGRRLAGPPPTAPLELLVHGQGTFIFKHGGDPTAHPEPLHVAFRTADAPAHDLVRLELDAAGSRLLVDEVVVADSPTGLVPDPYAYYWLSLDTSTDGRVRYGIGEARLETQLLDYPLAEEALRKRARQAATLHYNPAVERMRLLRDPIVAPVPLEVRSTDRLTMNDVASNRYLPQAALPAACRQLYDTIAGPSFVLDADDFPEFSQAIRYSIETPGGWCYQEIKKKREEAAKDPETYEPNRVYLRITMGHNGGESPGIPFVMEIWPAQCYSAVHQHAGANAIIRVLHGRISVALYPYLVPTHQVGRPQVKPFGERPFEQGAITWITPLLNQVHQLRNPEPAGGQPCITIQCYQYDESDTGHYPFFDYDKHDGHLHQFDPDSDMDFLAFKAQMQAEWQAYVNGWSLPDPAETVAQLAEARRL